jgi:hypothetical protein
MRLLQKVLVLGQQAILLFNFPKTNPYSDIVLHVPGNDSNEMHIESESAMTKHSGKSELQQPPCCMSSAQQIHIVLFDIPERYSTISNRLR